MPTPATRAATLRNLEKLHAYQRRIAGGFTPQGSRPKQKQEVPPLHTLIQMQRPVK